MAAPCGCALERMLLWPLLGCTVQPLTLTLGRFRLFFLQSFPSLSRRLVGLSGVEERPVDDICLDAQLQDWRSFCATCTAERPSLTPKVADKYVFPKQSHVRILKTALAHSLPVLIVSCFRIAIDRVLVGGRSPLVSDSVRTGCAASTGPFSSPRTRNGLLFGPLFSVGMDSFGRSGVRIFDVGARFRSLLLVWVLHFRCKNA